MLPTAPHSAIAIPPVKIDNVHQFYYLDDANQKFTYNGRTYTTRLERTVSPTFESVNLTAVEEPDSNSWCQFFSNIGRTRRESHINQFLVHPTERQFLVDIDKSLLYRQDLTRYPLNDGYPPGVSVNDSKNFTWARLWRKDKPVEVLISNRMLEFLSHQKRLGADICIASSGGWQNHYPDGPNIKADGAWTVTEFLRSNLLAPDRRCKIFSFDNGASLQAKFRQKDKCYFGGAFSKAREYGNSTTKMVNGKVRSYKTILIDDQAQQRAGFLRSIDPVEFGTGASWRDFFCMKAARVADFFLGEPLIEKLFLAAARKQT